MDFEGIGRVATNTTLAACAAGLAAMFFAFPKTRTWDVSFTVNGFLAGLVAITCPCYWVSPTGSILIGGVAGVLVVLGVEALEWLRVDDPIGAVPVHGFCGIWGTLSLGLFACGKYGASGPLGADNATPLTGLFYGGGVRVLAAQAIGSVIVTVSTFVGAIVMMYAISALGLLRVSREGEIQGLDLHEHGVPAYPEYALHAAANPQGGPAFTAAVLAHREPSSASAPGKA
jgi:Amt family ammonium transporter